MLATLSQGSADRQLEQNTSSVEQSPRRGNWARRSRGVVIPIPIHNSQREAVPAAEDDMSMPAVLDAESEGPIVISSDAESEGPVAISKDELQDLSQSKPVAGTCTIVCSSEWINLLPSVFA